MDYRVKEKSWLWYLTFPFAHNNTTALGRTIYIRRGSPGLTNSTRDHEIVHLQQQARVGVLWFVLGYLFALPILWNPFRWSWELEAFRKNSTERKAKEKLRSYRYGWLVLNG